MTSQSYSSDALEDTAKENLLRQLSNRFRELTEATKAWKVFKQNGRAGLPANAQFAFDLIFNFCSKRGLFINPLGELESMLIDQGIASTTDKKGWIATALRLVPSLNPEDGKNPWVFLKGIHDYIRQGRTPS